MPPAGLPGIAPVEWMRREGPGQSIATFRADF